MTEREAMYISEQYIEEVTRWKTQAMNKKLSNKALKKLTKAGVRKPVTSYLAGYERGTRKILGKASDRKLKTGSAREKYDWRDPKDTSASNSVSHNKKQALRMGRKDRDSAPLSKRHEAYETSETKKHLKKGAHPFTTSTKFMKKTPKLNVRNAIRGLRGKELKQHSTHVGTHASPKVLSKEKRDINQLTSIYPHLKNQKDIKDIVQSRKETGEDKFISSHTPRQISKLTKKLSAKKQERSRKLRNAERDIDHTKKELDNSVANKTSSKKSNKELNRKISKYNKYRDSKEEVDLSK